MTNSACTVTCATKDILDVHFIQDHCYPCFKCEEAFPTETDLNLHLKNVHADKKEKGPSVPEPGQRSSTPPKCVMCDRCDQLFGWETFFKKHICNPHLASQTVQCDQCEFTSDSVKDFVSHLLQVHTHYLGTYKCTFCDFEAIENKTLKDHVEDVHGMLAILNGLARNQALVGEGFDKFRDEVSTALGKLIDDNIIMKQELFILRQAKANHNSDNGTSASEEAEATIEISTHADGGPLIVNN